MTGAYKTIFIFLSFYSFFLNITSYFQYMTQAVLKFKILSTMNVLQASLNVVVVLSMFLLGNMGYINELNYRLYLVFYIAVYACVAMMYMIYFKNLTAGPSYSLRRQKVALFKTLKSGINVTLSYQITVLILNLDNQFISLLFNARTFGIYSFAYSLISITTTVLTAVSTVIFPHLNRKKVPEIIASYDNNMRSLMMVIYIAVMVYYPVFVFVHIFLTQYIESLQFFRILLPGVGITSCISLIIFNYYKILKKV